MSGRRPSTEPRVERNHAASLQTRSSGDLTATLGTTNRPRTSDPSIRWTRSWQEAVSGGSGAIACTISHWPGQRAGWPNGNRTLLYLTFVRRIPAPFAYNWFHVLPALCRSPCHEKRVHASAPDRAKAKAFVPPARMPARKRQVLARGAHPSSDPPFRRRRHGRPRGRSLPAALAPAGGRPLTHLRRPSCWLRGCLRSAPGCGMHFKRLSSQMGLKKLWSGLMHGGSRAPKRVH